MAYLRGDPGRSIGSVTVKSFPTRTVAVPHPTAGDHLWRGEARGDHFVGGGGDGTLGQYALVILDLVNYHLVACE